MLICYRRRRGGATQDAKSDHILVNSVLAFERERVIILAVRLRGSWLSDPLLSWRSPTTQGLKTMTTDLMRKVLVAGAAVAALSVAACSKPADKPADASAAPAADAAAAPAAAPATGAMAPAAPAAADASKPADATAAPAAGAMAPAAPADAKK
jgi:hypothetical protein